MNFFIALYVSVFEASFITLGLICPLATIIAALKAPNQGKALSMVHPLKAVAVGFVVSAIPWLNVKAVMKIGDSIERSLETLENVQ